MTKEPESWSDLPDHEKEEFIDYLTLAIRNVMDSAEEAGHLYELITTWPKQKIVAYQLAVIVANELGKEDQ